MPRAFWLLLVGILPLTWPDSAVGGRAEHVVAIVWDGLRPDFVSPQYAPVLHELATRGTLFKNHHSTYVTSTEVNGASLSTGMFPNHGGIVANSQYRAELSWVSPYGTESLEAIRRGDLISDGHYLEAATLPEILQKAGFRTIIAGAKPVVLLHDRAPKKVAQVEKESATLFRGQTLPRSLMKSLTAIPEVGPFPVDTSTPQSSREKAKKWLRSAQDQVFLYLYGKPKETPASRLIDAWTTRALVHGLWTNGPPKYTLLWLSEPDASQHSGGVGSENAEEALEECDRNLGMILKALRDRGVLDRTDILVMSDHGFSTIDRGPNVVKALKRAGFIADKKFDNPEAGDVMVVNLGGSVFFYVYEHEEKTIRRLVDFLQTTDFAGVIFSAVPVEGTFPLSQVRLDARHVAPDVAISMRWNSGKSDGGAPGLLTSAEGRPGRGAHGSLSRFDLRNVLIASGPDFKQGFVSELPSGNVDVAPTVLAVLGVPAPRPMDGRVLAEAMVGIEGESLRPEEQTLEASRELHFHTWRQYLKFTRVGSVIYLEEGNGESGAK